jgi:hypothetical protein
MHQNYRICGDLATCNYEMLTPDASMRTFIDSTKLLRTALARDRRLDALHGTRDEAVDRRHGPQRELGSGDGIYQYLERHRQKRPAHASATVGLQAAAGRAVRQDGKARRQ